MMREAMTELQQSTESALVRILDRGQYTRLKQIQLQLEGLSALLRPDMIEKLNMDEAQVEQLRELMDERRQAQRETRQARMELMKSAFPNPNQGNNGQNGGNAGNGQNGGNGGRRNRFNDPAFQAAMKKFWENPETKAKMDQFQSQDEMINNRFMAVVMNRVLSKRQSTTYKKLLGAPFDLSKVRGGPGFGMRNANRAGTSNSSANGAPSQVAKANSGSRDEADAADTKSATTQSGVATSPSTARPKRKSLRELRGLGQSKSDQP
jgi:hypothetical protein